MSIGQNQVAGQGDVKTAHRLWRWEVIWTTKVKSQIPLKCRRGNADKHIEIAMLRGFYRIACVHNPRQLFEINVTGIEVKPVVFPPVGIATKENPWRLARFEKMDRGAERR